ncbi:MAG: DUF4389 domain-containing protein [Chloroflexi bacterium]|nr:DUF4389 domain-containing protein [Chloroflexota bacterium]
MAQSSAQYPVQFSVDYPDRQLNRLSSFSRLLFILPIGIVISAINNSTNGILFGPVLLLVLFRRKYPRWWFDFNVQYQRFSTRFGLYLGLVTDDYPSTDEEQGVHLEIDYPDAMQLNRWLPLVKWILAIPHYVALFVLTIISIIVIVIGWFVILFTGNFPRGFHDFIVGVTRWTLRVTAYAFLLTTDEYPPFSLD